MKPCKHGNHPFSFCKECCREMNEQIELEENDTAASESELNDFIYLTLWIHGTAGETDKPCNEVNVIEFTGSRIKVKFINFVMNLDGVDMMILLEGLPTENWLKVQVLPSFCDDGGWFFEVKNFEIDK